MASNPIAPIPMAAFARFFEAKPTHKVTMVREARAYIMDPKGYRLRDYYLDLRNTLRKTHWETDDISIFEAALDPLVSQQKNAGKKEHFRKVGKAYIDYWKKHDTHFFKVPSTTFEIAGLSIRVSAEVGMSYHGDNLALKLWWNAPRPTRLFRQAIQYLTEQGRDGTWRQDWQALLWDVRRVEVLPPVAISRDFALGIEGQAMAFQHYWKSLGEMDPRERALDPNTIDNA